MWLKTVSENIAAKKIFAIATVVTGAHVGAKWVIYPDGATDGAPADADWNAQVITDAQALLAAERSETRTYGDAEIFIESILPPPRLIVVGGVHTAIPLSQYAKILGFHVTIVDGRGRFATRERFPHVDELIVEWPDDVIPRLQIDAMTYVVILTHDPKFDLPALKALSATKPRYIGAMGSRETRRQHMAELRAQGVPDEFLKTVYGPVGLDLGGRSPEETALAIIAQIIAVRHGHGGGHLQLD
ncbi:MAG: XdhC family protein [Anaerolineae bacterium]|nr:XdhC family protein [Anaerolineae bacterium]